MEMKQRKPPRVMAKRKMLLQDTAKRLKTLPLDTAKRLKTLPLDTANNKRK
jgi:hypothetical protein